MNNNNGNDHFLGNVIRQHRIMAGLTLSELSRRIDVSPSQISRIERGRSFTSASVLTKIARNVGLDEHNLLLLAIRLLMEEPDSPYRGATQIIATIKQLAAKK